MIIIMKEDQLFKSYSILRKLLNLSDSRFTPLKMRYVHRVIREINVKIRKPSSIVLVDTH